jgi:putative membrane protein
MKLCFGLFGVILLSFTPAWAQQRLDNKDADFVKEAAQGGMLEVKLGEQALQNASNPDVKRFAQRMVDEHGKANKDLMSVVGTKGVMVPKELDAKSKEMCEKLGKLKGADFDKEYMRQMVKDHEEDVAEFQKASKNLQDPDVKAWVMKTLPTVTEHLRQAKEIQSKIDKK